MKIIILLCLIWQWDGIVSLDMNTTTTDATTTTTRPTLMPSKLEPLDKRIKARLFAGLISEWRMSCDKKAEKEFYKKIEKENAVGFERIMNNTNLTQICNRFRGLLCEKFFNKDNLKAESRCLCIPEQYWGGSDHKHCSVPLTRPCGTWMRNRSTYRVPTKISNLNEYWNCTKDAYCAGRGFCVCQRGKKCNTTITGTVKEAIEAELQVYFHGIDKEHSGQYKGRFLEAGANCDPQYTFYREDAVESRGIDYPRLREHLESNLTAIKSKLYCDVLHWYECRRSICQCRDGFRRHSEVEYKCKPLQTVNCNYNAWKESNWYNAGIVECLNPKEHCVVTTDKINSICCPIRVKPETLHRCPRNDCDPTVKYTYFMTFILGVLLLAHILP